MQTNSANRQQSSNNVADDVIIRPVTCFEISHVFYLPMPLKGMTAPRHLLRKIQFVPEVLLVSNVKCCHACSHGVSHGVVRSAVLTCKSFPAALIAAEQKKINVSEKSWKIRPNHWTNAFTFMICCFPAIHPIIAVFKFYVQGKFEEDIATNKLLSTYNTCHVRFSLMTCHNIYFWHIDWWAHKGNRWRPWSGWCTHLQILLCHRVWSFSLI